MQALVVDDSATMRQILREYLKKLGFAVTEAANGREALDVLKGMPTADLVLVDWNMPEMDGVSFVRAVRADPSYAALPLLMVTTNTELSQVSTALEAGANEYIMKPFTREMIREKIELLGFPKAEPMSKKRILIVDDSVVIRRSLANALARDADLEVVGSASNGRIALMKIPLLHPDVVTLDVEMPDMDGLQALAEIRKRYPQLPVIMLSEPTDRGVAATLDALTLGAKDYVTKPDIAMNADDGLQILSDELAAKIVLHCPGAIHQSPPPKSRARIPPDGTSLGTTVNAAAPRVDVLAIAVSTGGPNALMDLIPRFPADFPVPILIVQHMPPIFTKLLAERLAAKCKIRVTEAGMHQTVLAGGAWIAPGNFHMVVEIDNGSVRI